MKSRTEEVIVTFKLPRNEAPALYDTLAQIPKGRERAGRLRTLAITGLAAETMLSGKPGISTGALQPISSPTSAVPAESGATGLDLGIEDLLSGKTE